MPARIKIPNAVLENKQYAYTVKIPTPAPDAIEPARTLEILETAAAKGA
jgi:hypothetical protein